MFPVSVVINHEIENELESHSVLLILYFNVFIERFWLKQNIWSIALVVMHTVMKQSLSVNAELCSNLMNDVLIFV